MAVIRMRRVALAVVVAVALLLVLFRPMPPEVRRDAYFETLQDSLRRRGVQRPALVLDLDRLDGNLAQLRHVLGTDLQYRATTKSLPSYELLRHVLVAMGSQRVMEFHAPYLTPLIDAIVTPSGAVADGAGGAAGPGKLLPHLDVLLGKPSPAPEVDAFYASPPSPDKLAATQLRWLIDHSERLAEYLAIAERRGVRMDLVIELDIGLHRGGVAEPASLRKLVETIEAHPQRLRLTGVMGYEGHVAHAPPLLKSEEGAQASAFAQAMERLTGQVRFLQSTFPAYARPDFLINSGGSKTFPRFRQGGHVVGSANELAVGSALLKPADFDAPILAALQPALFVADPVLKRMSPGQLPVAEWAGTLWRIWDRGREDVLYVYGGGWDVRPVYPAGLRSNPLYNSRPVDTRIPNQTLLNVAAKHPIRPGDFVFYRPQQGDVMTQFEEIWVVRGGQILDVWHPLPHRL